MAANDVEVGKLTVPVALDMKEMKRQAKGELKQAAERAGREASAALGKGLSSDRRAARQAAEQTVADFLDGVKRSARIKMADAKEVLLRGLIDNKEYAKRGREAGEAANKAILDEIRRRATAGRLKTDDFLGLTDALKVAGKKGGEKFGQEVKKGAKNPLQDLNKWLAGGFAVGVLMAFTGLANRVIRMFQRVATSIRDTLEAGGTARTLRSSFESVAGSRGADPTAMLGDLRTALRGTATDLELMRRATFALNAGLPATGAQMGELASIARRLGAAVGKDAAESFERMADGIAKGRAQTLQELGIMTRRQDALRAWEQQTGRNSAALSEQEKVLIHLGAVLEEGRAKVKAMGDEADEAATPVQQLGTFLANLRDRTAEAVANSAPVVGMLTEIGDAAAGSAGKVQGLANHVGAYVATMTELSRKYGEGPLRIVGKTAGFLARNTFGLDDGTEAGRTFDKHLRAANIQSETSIVRLLEQQATNLEELLDLRGQEGKAAERRRDMLQAENKLIGERVKLLTPLPDVPSPTGPTGPTEDQIKEADAALKQLTASMREFGTAAKLGVSPLRDAPDSVQAAVRELVKAQEQVRQAEEQIAAIRAGGGEVPAGAQAYLHHLRDVRDELRGLADEEIAHWQRELPLILSGVENSISRMPDYLVQVGDGIQTLGSAMADLGAQADAVTAAERELLHARLAQDPERIAAAEKQVAAARKALRDMTAALAKALLAAGVPAEKLNELLAEMNALLEGVGMKAEEITEGERDWGEMARTFEGVARGVLSVADAMGILNDRQRRALQGAIDLASGIGQIAGGNIMGGAFQAVGGVVSLLKGALSDGAERVQLIESQAALIRALNQLRDAVMHDTTVAEKARLLERGGQIMESQGGYSRGGVVNARPLTAEEIAILKEVEEKARMSGMIYKDGRVNTKALSEALDKIEKMDLDAWDKSLEGQLDRLNWSIRTLGDEAGDATKRLTRFVGVVSEFSPEFVSQFQEIFEEQGEEAALAWLKSLADAFADGGLENPLIRAIFGGNVTARDVQRLIEEGMGYVSGAQDDGATRSFQVSRSITEVTGNRLYGGIITVAHWSEMTAHHTAELVRLLSGGSSLPNISPPSPADLRAFVAPAPAPAVPPGPDQTTVDIDVQIDQITVTGSPQEAGRQIADSAIEAIDHKLAQRLVDRMRAAGKPTAR
jgi:hypothetical protein